MMIHSKKEIGTIIGYVGNAIAIGLFISPVPTILQIVRTEAVGEFSPNPYLATALNCAFWALYGMPFVHPHSTLIISINVIGLLLEAIFIAIFFKYSPIQGKWKMIKILCAELVFFVVTAMGVLLGAHTHERRTFIIGIFCIIVNIFMYAAPVLIVKDVIQTRSVQYMPLSLTLASFLNGACWTVYGCFPVDVNLIIPNAMGTVLGILQLIVYAWVRCNPREEGQAPVMNAAPQ